MLSTKEYQLLMCSFRYALGRSSGIATNIIDYIIMDWDKLEVCQREQVKNEIQEAFDRLGFISHIDQIEWKRILSL
jgi:hypothetical protein